MNPCQNRFSTRKPPASCQTRYTLSILKSLNTDQFTVLEAECVLQGQAKLSQARPSSPPSDPSPSSTIRSNVLGEDRLPHPSALRLGHGKDGAFRPGPKNANSDPTPTIEAHTATWTHLESHCLLQVLIDVRTGKCSSSDCNSESKPSKNPLFADTMPEKNRNIGIESIPYETQEKRTNQFRSLAAPVWSLAPRFGPATGLNLRPELSTVGTPSWRGTKIDLRLGPGGGAQNTPICFLARGTGVL